jgi:hypothetical protein
MDAAGNLVRPIICDGDDGPVIAHVFSMGDDFGNIRQPERNANAALLAAAPALRDALAAFVRGVDEGIYITSSRVAHDHANAARTLLASLPGGTDGR